MKYIITGRNIEVTEGLRSAIYEKIGKLERYFTPDATVYVTLSVQKDRQKIEVTIPVKGSLVRAEQESSDMYVSIDLVEEIIERQLRRYKTKLIAREQDGGDFSSAFIEEEDEFSEENEGINIARVKRFPLKPMNPEEACLQMELLGHNFFVFYNCDEDRVNVVYKRKNGTYGLIGPEF